MNHRLHLRFEQLENATEKLLRAAEALGDQSHQVPAPGQWSAAHVVQHLVVAEQGVEQYIQHKLQQKEGLRTADLKGRFRSLLLRVLLRLPGMKFRAPERLAALMPADSAIPSLAELRQQWAATRRKLERLLNEYPSPLMNQAIFKHPRVGMLTIQQTLDFMLDHVLHHQQQLTRIGKTLAAAKPQSAA
ncbi:DinB family protein [Hymenobacter busanensis]|uniref:DinB family protein n=1 Tax=Hymenobacter busanensis TaxID=2607656 RepID=A0A7L4ZUN1_9BACT|nr:DinB family protein [Hymenobacter busanensis]KAA9339528.1 DinB family protein [Hymenobacter busanensis]QHJ06717.1 DinB family protein [Hymenobacter busanensis]